MPIQKAASPIRLREMPQLVEAVDPEDDWTGVTDAAVRRKRQNRLNVRAYRRRKARGLQSRDSTHAPPCTTELRVPCWVEDYRAIWHLPASVANARMKNRSPLLPITPAVTKLDGIVLPLSSDHLIILLQFNVLRGCLTNRQLLSNLQSIPIPTDDSPAPAPRIFPSLGTSSLKSLPPSLHPTHLQLTVPHEHWVDILPHPILRDNLICASGKFDEDELWSDSVGGLFEGFPASDIEHRGAIMWSTPWHVSGWELSEGFCRKWSWALEGCEDLLEATNRWRTQRGEEPLTL